MSRLRVDCDVHAKLHRTLSPGSSATRSSAFADRIECPAPVEGLGCRPVLSRLRSVCLAAPLVADEQDASPRLLQPTNDTSTRGSLDFRARGFRHAAARCLALGVNRTLLPCDAAPSCDDAGPGCPALDGAGTASTPRGTVFRACILSNAGASEVLEEPRPVRGFSSRAEPREWSLTPPVAPHAAPEQKLGAGARRQNRFRRPLVNEDDFPGPRRLLPTSAVWTRFRAIHFQNWLTTRHRCRRFATVGPASDTRSPPPRSRAERLDRFAFPDALHARARTATHRSSISATDAIREHHHGCPNSAAPHPQSPAGAALFSKRAAFRRRLELRMAAGCFRSAASRDVTGQGLHVETRFASRVRLLPPRPLAVRTSPQPDRLGHLMSHARDDSPLGGVGVVGAMVVDPCTNAPGDSAACATSASRGPLPRTLDGQGRLARSPAKESALRCTRGAFHRRTRPFRGLPRLPTSCPQPVE